MLLSRDLLVKGGILGQRGRPRPRHKEPAGVGLLIPILSPGVAPALFSVDFLNYSATSIDWYIMNGRPDAEPCSKKSYSAFASSLLVKDTEMVQTTRGTWNAQSTWTNRMLHV